MLPWDGGSPVTKSRAMWDQGLMGVTNGWSKPAGGRLLLLLRAQIEQAETYSRTSLSMDGHQKYLLRKVRVRWTPGWQVNLAVWAQWRADDLAVDGTYRRLGGPVPGSGSLFRPRWIWSSTAQVTPNTQVLGRILSGVSGELVEYRRERASGFTLRVTGQ